MNEGSHLSFFNPIILFVCALSFNIIPGQAQPQQRERYEKEQKNFDENFIVIPLKEDGIALLRNIREYNDGNQVRELIILDSALGEKAIVNFEIKSQGQFIGYEHSPGFIHLLYVKNEMKGEMELVSIELASQVVTRYDILAELKLQLTHFIKTGDNFALAGYVNFEPAVFIYSTSAKSLKIIPGFFQKNTVLIDLHANQNGTFNSVLIDREIYDSHKVIFRTFDSSGTQLLQDITPVKDHILQSGISSSLEREDLVLLGTWGNRKTQQAYGFYSMTINPFTDQEIHFNYFGELSHYLDYLKPKRAEIIKAKTKKAIDAGRNPDFTNHILPYKIIEHKQGFLLLAESFIPSRRPGQYSNYNSPYSGNPYNNNPYGYNSPYNNRAAGYDPGIYGGNVANDEDITTVQTSVIAFDGAGKIKADYSLKLDEVKISSMGQVADFYLDNDSIYFLYRKESMLKIKSINLKDSKSADREEKIKLTDSADTARPDSREGAVRHWFANNFYVWGYQTIRNPGTKNRNVFFINRIVIP